MFETSHSLLDRMREADSDSWSQLVELYSPLLRSWIGRYDDVESHDVDDLVQDVLMTVSQEIPQFRHNNRPGAFRKWLRQIVVNRLRYFWRSRKNRPNAVGGSDFLEQLDQLEDDKSAASKVWDRAYDRELMDRLLELVRPHFAANTWMAFRRQVLDEASAQTVASELEMPIGAVYGAKSRVLAAIRKLAAGLIT